MNEQTSERMDECSLIAWKGTQNTSSFVSCSNLYRICGRNKCKSLPPVRNLGCCVTHDPPFWYKVSGLGEGIPQYCCCTISSSLYKLKKIPGDYRQFPNSRLTNWISTKSLLNGINEQWFVALGGVFSLKICWYLWVQMEHFVELNLKRCLLVQ